MTGFTLGYLSSLITAFRVAVIFFFGDLSYQITAVTVSLLEALGLSFVAYTVRGKVSKREVKSFWRSRNVPSHQECPKISGN